MYGCVFAQAGLSDRPKFIVDLGINQPSVSNTAFNLWAASNYGKNENPGIGGLVDIALAGKWDVNLHLSVANPYLITGLEFGKRITPPFYPITSYINLDYGRFDAVSNSLAPVN